MRREAGLFVNETPKQQADSPLIEHHSIYEHTHGLRIHLKLNGIFSYFPTRALTTEECKEWESYPVIFITPDSDSWDPYSAYFVDEEDAMVDIDGMLVQQP
jgi:hypothetical protein